jgi:DNA polymerase III subunit gamma/tau
MWPMVADVEAPLALYRRYRPETFAEVIGQDHVTGPLRNALSNNRVNHAYLFSGPRGCGKTTSARILARAINCEKGPLPEPCGECQSCRDLARGGPGSIDVIEIDAASHGGVEDARDLRERAFFAPVQSRYKIYIIDEAHMVTTQGFNALLKLVEEPPPHLKFIFATTEPDKVIGTIRSRTHHYPFRLVPPKILAEYLAKLCEAEGVTIAPAALPLVVRAGAGSVRDSLSVLDQLIGGAGPDGVTYQLAVALLGFTPDSLLDACVDGFAAHDSGAVFEVIDKVIETGQDPKRFAEDLLRRLRDLVVLSAVPTAVASGLIDVAEDQGERLQTQAAGIGSAELTRAADIVAAGLLEMRGATAPRLQLELICAKVLLPGADDSTNGIQARLDRIERRLTIGVPAAGEVPAAAAPSLSESAPAEAPSVQPPSGGAPSHSGAQVENSAAWPAEPAPPEQSVGSRREASGQPGAGRPTNAGTAAPVQPARVSEAPVAATQPSLSSVHQSSGSVTLADVRRLWPEILEAVKSKRRFAWIMLSQNAQVIAIDEQTITLGLVNAGARESFTRSGSDEILRQAMVDAIGLTRKVEAVVDPSTDPNAAAPAQPAARATSAPPKPDPAAWDQSTPAAPVASTGSGGAAGRPGSDGPERDTGQAGNGPGGNGPAGNGPAGNGPGGNGPGGNAGPTGSDAQQSSAATEAGSTPAGQPSAPAGPDDPAEASAARVPGDQPTSQQSGELAAPAATPEPSAEQRREQAGSKRRAAEAAVAAEQAQRAVQAPPSEAPSTPEDEADEVGEDDVILEEDSRSHTELLRETLGAQIITEEPN